MKKRNLKKERGITLIALVVTIVVLLILAGISINAVLGNNGLISRAKDAREKTEQDQVNTEKAINSLVDEMEAILGNGGSGDTGDGDGDGTGDTVDLTGLKIGDYVNYTYDTVTNGYSLLSTQSGYQEWVNGSGEVDKDQTVTQSATTLQWRVLNIDEENGTIDLVSENPTDNTVGFGGALGYNNGVLLLNDMCAHLYSNSSLEVTARSINLADMEKHLTIAGITTRNEYTYTGMSTSAKYGATVTYTGNYSYYPNLYASQPGAGINLAEGATVTQPDLTGVDPYNESAKVYSEPTTETYGKATDTGLTVTQTYYNIPIDSTNYGEAAAVLSNSNYYWIASRSTNTTFPNEDNGEPGAEFGLREGSRNIFVSKLLYSGYISGESRGSRLRPVVTLSTNLLDGTKDAEGAWNLKSDIE